MGKGGAPTALQSAGDGGGAAWWSTRGWTGKGEAARGRRASPMVWRRLGAPTVHHSSRRHARKGSSGGGAGGADGGRQA